MILLGSTAFFIFEKERKIIERTMQVTVRLPMEVYESLQKLSSKNKKAMAENMRIFIEKGLNVQANKEDIDFIRKQIREELYSIISPNIERIVKICVKSGIVSAAGYFLNAEALTEFVHPSRQRDFKKSLDESKKLGVAYFRIKDSEIEEYLNRSDFE